MTGDKFGWINAKNPIARSGTSTASRLEFFVGNFVDVLKIKQFLLQQLFQK